MFRKFSLLVVALILVPTFAACAAKTDTVTVTNMATVTQPVTVTVTSNVTSPGVTSTATSTVIATITLAPTPTVTGTPTTTAGALAATGEGLFEANCTFTYCHASFDDPNASGAFNAQPSAVAFGKSALSFFDDAGNLFVFIKSFMHQANTKLFLTDDQYAQIIAYLLVQNGTLQSSSLFGLGNMGGIKLMP
jgi:hypothetical protein